jgi:hypothetical protein
LGGKREGGRERERERREREREKRERGIGKIKGMGFES